MAAWKASPKGGLRTPFHPLGVPLGERAKRASALSFEIVLCSNDIEKIMATEQLKIEHTEVLSVLGALVGSIERIQHPSEPEVARRLLVKLGELLEEHIRFEEDVLYSVLRRDASDYIKQMVAQLSPELDELTSQLMGLVSRWGGEGKIEDSPKAFSDLAIPVLATLSERIMIEDTTFIPALEQLKSGQFPR